jgi:hypothetical protein
MSVVALLAGSLALQGCSNFANPLSSIGDMVGNPIAGAGNFSGDTVSFKTNPNRPSDDAPNVQRVMGKGYEPEPLLPESGNVWPGPLPPEKTMSDLQKEGPLGGDQTPAPTTAPVVAPRPVPRASVAPVAPPAAAPAAIAAPPATVKSDSAKRAARFLNFMLVTPSLNKDGSCHCCAL